MASFSVEKVYHCKYYGIIRVSALEKLYEAYNSFFQHYHFSFVSSITTKMQFWSICQY